MYHYNNLHDEEYDSYASNQSQHKDSHHDRQHDHRYLSKINWHIGGWGEERHRIARYPKTCHTLKRVAVVRDHLDECGWRDEGQSSGRHDWDLTWNYHSQTHLCGGGDWHNLTLGVDVEFDRGYFSDVQDDDIVTGKLYAELQ